MNGHVDVFGQATWPERCVLASAVAVRPDQLGLRGNATCLCAIDLHRACHDNVAGPEAKTVPGSDRASMN